MVKYRSTSTCAQIEKVRDHVTVLYTVQDIRNGGLTQTIDNAKRLARCLVPIASNGTMIC